MRKHPALMMAFYQSPFCRDFLSFSLAFGWNVAVSISPDVRVILSSTIRSFLPPDDRSAMRQFTVKTHSFWSAAPIFRQFSATPVLLSWKPWNDKFTVEVFPGQYPVDPIPFNTADLLQYTRTNRALFIQGSPSCGKSSLAHLIEEEAVAKGFYSEVFVSRYTGTDRATVDAKMTALERTGKQKTCLFIVDEAQAQILEKVISPSALLKTGHHAMYFGTTLQTTDEFTSPAELNPHKHWMHAPSVDRQVVRDFAARVLTHHGAESKEAARLAEQAFDFAGASMGVLIRLLEAIVKRKGTFPTSKELLLHDDYQPRVVVNGGVKWHKDPAKTAIAEELLAVGKVRVGPDSPEPWKAMLRQGFICPLRNFDSDKSIIRWRADSVDVGWAHSWQATYCRLLQFPIIPRHTEWLAQAKLQAPIDALLRFLPAFDTDTIIPNVVNGITSKKANEYNFQHQFANAVNLARPEMSVRSENQTKGPKGQLGRLDFLLQPCPGVNSDLWWGYELLIGGAKDKLDEHKSRFAKPGKYCKLEWSDYLVLDCRTEPLLNADASKSAKVATISPHITEGWNVIVLDHRGKRLNIPRDGVPRYVADWTAETPEAIVAVKLFDAAPKPCRRAPAAPALRLPIMKRPKSQC